MHINVLLPNAKSGNLPGVKGKLNCISIADGRRFVFLIHGGKAAIGEGKPHLQDRLLPLFACVIKAQDITLAILGALKDAHTDVGIIQLKVAFPLGDRIRICKSNTTANIRFCQGMLHIQKVCVVRFFCQRHT